MDSQSDMAIQIDQSSTQDEFQEPSLFHQGGVTVRNISTLNLPRCGANSDCKLVASATMKFKFSYFYFQLLRQTSVTFHCQEANPH